MTVLSYFAHLVISNWTSYFFYILQSCSIFCCASIYCKNNWFSFSLLVLLINPSLKKFYSRPYHSTKKRPSSQTAITLRPHVVSTSINLRANVSAKTPTQPPRQSTADSFVGANSIHIGHYTMGTTEPGFITALDRNSIQQDSGKQGAGQWQFTTEPGFVTRFKIKPSSNKPKPNKKPFQGNGGKNSTKHGNKVSRPTITPPTTTR